MAQPQSAICAKGGNFAIFLTATLAEGEAAAARLRKVAAQLPELTEALAVRLGEPALTSALAFGAGIWPRLGLVGMPAGLQPFTPLSGKGRDAPATPADLLLHIHSPRHDANFALARNVAERLGGAERIVEEIHGFRYLDGRDLTGFVDGTENPRGDERPLAALVGAEDADFAGGSYVSVQRYVHNLAAWDRLPVAEQEGIIGRTKVTDTELPPHIKPPTAHISRVVIEEDGQELELLRHSLPYGTTRENGLYFLAYARSPDPFRRMLRRMIGLDGDGLADRLLEYSRPVTGASFFAPSEEFLRALG